MDRIPPTRWLQLPFPRDENLAAELHRFDPYDIMGYVALTATLTNVVASILGIYAAYDLLLSVSLIAGLLSLLNWDGVLGKAALMLMALHVAGLHVVRILPWL